LLAVLPQVGFAKWWFFAATEVAEHVNAWWQYSLETNYFGSSPSVSI